MDIDRYLARFGSFNCRDVSLNTLTTLQLNHLQHVPFENLDIPLKRKIEISPARLYDKLVEQRRGGFCYELNGLFAWLLRSLGYDVQMLAGRVHNGTDFGPPFDHLLLLVRGFAEPMLVDAGFGDSFLEPLTLTSDPQPQANGTYHLTPDGDGYTLWRAKPNETPAPQYTFSFRELSTYEFCGDVWVPTDLERIHLHAKKRLQYGNRLRPHHHSKRAAYHHRLAYANQTRRHHQFRSGVPSDFDGQVRYQPAC